MYRWKTFCAYHAATKTWQICQDVFFLPSLRTYTHAHIRTHTHTHARTRIHTHTRTHTHPHTHTRTYTHSRTKKNTHPHTHASTHIHARTHTRTDTHTHKHSHARTHVGTQKTALRTMPQCCRCNGSGRCVSCACARAKTDCTYCLPSKRSRCSNFVPPQNIPQLAMSLCTEAMPEVCLQVVQETVS